MAPIHHAALDGDAEALRQALESGESPDALYRENAFHLTKTPLHLLCLRDNGGDRAACFDSFAMRGQIWKRPILKGSDHFTLRLSVEKKNGVAASSSPR